MTDVEVEKTLREIRERVRAETPAPARGHAGGAEDALSRVEANLAVAERAWDKLPPVQSNRAGFAARAELWIKRKIKRAAHWFTWEQVNFNAAATHALRDALAVIRGQQQQLSELRAEVAREVARLDAHWRDHYYRLEESFDARLRAQDERLGERFDAQLRERSEHILEEQRVCYRQLSLEASETAVRLDRARRDLEARLAEIEKAVTSDK